MTQGDNNGATSPTAFGKMAESIMGAIDDGVELDGPWHGYIEEFILIDPADGTQCAHKNGSLQGRWGREVGILVKSENVPDTAPLDPKGWIVEYADDGRCVRGTVVGHDSLVDEQDTEYHRLYFVPDVDSDPNKRGQEG